jgi:phosphatidylglycerophosphate synthase
VVYWRRIDMATAQGDPTTSPADAGRPARAAGRLFARWEIVHAALLGAALLSAAVARRPLLFAAIGAAVLAHRIWIGRAQWLSMRFGWPNAVTAIRGLIVVAMGVVFDAATGPGAAAFALSVYALDGLDGWLARRLDQGSAFGGAFDAETDAYFVAMLTVVLAAHGVVGAWVLIGGLLRYAYVLVVALVPGARGEVPRHRLARYIFAILVISLGLAFLPFPWLSTPIAAIGTAFVTWSFARSFYWSFHGAAPDEP